MECGIFRLDPNGAIDPGNCLFGVSQLKFGYTQQMERRGVARVPRDNPAVQFGRFGNPALRVKGNGSPKQRAQNRNSFSETRDA
jgi:hypothetical protein